MTNLIIFIIFSSTNTKSMSGTYSNRKTFTFICPDGLLRTEYITSNMDIRMDMRMYTRNLHSLYSLLDSDTEAKNIATEIANFMSKLDTPQAKAEFDRKVKNAFQEPKTYGPTAVSKRVHDPETGPKTKTVPEPRPEPRG